MKCMGMAWRCVATAVRSNCCRLLPTAFITGVLLALACMALPVRAAFLQRIPQRLVQPNGETLACFASGDEFYSWLHDAAGYTIIQDPATGWYVYAREKGGDLVPTDLVAGQTDPRRAGLRPGARISTASYRTAVAAARGGSPVKPAEIRRAPRTGAMQNLVIFIRFSDDPEFTDDADTYFQLFNNGITGVNSLNNYFREVSYEQLSVTSSFFPAPAGGMTVSYKDTHPRRYYQPYNAVTNPDGYQGGNDGTARTEREHALLAGAVTALAPQIPASLDIDGDRDGYVDNVCFIVAGSPGGWSSLLWPHMWSLYSRDVRINGKRVWTYNFQLRNSIDVGVLCHEMFHSLGAPDLYHYSYDGLESVGIWDLMQWDLNPPQHMSTYMKFRYGGWIGQIPEITASGVYTLHPIASVQNNCYKIRSPYSATEYYVLEYRRRAGLFENGLPGDGLLVYRVNTAQNGRGNAQGPPDEIYVYRPGGTPTVNGEVSYACLSAGSGRVQLTDATSPSGFLSDGSSGGLSISQVGAAGATISFRVDLPALVADAETVRVPEGGSAVVMVHMNLCPRAPVTVTVARTAGDPDISAAPGTVTFTPDNWATPQPITLAAAPDDDAADGEATFRLTADALPPLELPVYEQDSATCRPDLLLGAARESYTGENVYAAPEAQTVTRTARPGERMAFYLKLENERAIPDTFTVTALPGGSGMTFAGYDGPEDGSEITAAIAGNGWTIGPVPAGGAVEFRLELALDRSVPYGASRDLLITAVSLGNPAVTDTVCAVVTRAANGAPSAAADAFTIEEDSTLAAPAPGLLANDADADGDPLSATLVTSPGHGRVTLQADGGFTYRPDENWHGDDTFTYAAGDGLLASAPVSVRITVTAVNDAPAALPQAVALDQDTTCLVTLQAADADGDAPAFQVTRGPAHGRLTGTAPQLIYTPDAGWNGTDTFVFIANDGQATSAEATVTLTVRRVVLPLTGVTLRMNLPSPRAAGSPITLTASATGGDAVEFLFRVGFTDGNKWYWSVLRGYAPGASCTWTPAVPRAYTLVVMAREAGSTASKVYTAARYTVAAPLTAVSLGATPATTRALSTPIVLTAQPTGGASVEYLFRAGYQDNNGWHWSVLRPYGSTRTCTWLPPASRTYTLVVWARERGCAQPYQVGGVARYTVLAAE